MSRYLITLSRRAGQKIDKNSYKNLRNESLFDNTLASAETTRLQCQTNRLR
jgi:hypothetical protein